MAAGFGAAGYSVDKYRSLTTKRAALKAAQNEIADAFEKDLSKYMSVNVESDLGKRMMQKLGSPSEESNILRKWVAGERLKPTEFKTIFKLYREDPELARELKNTRGVLQSALKSGDEEAERLNTLFKGGKGFNFNKIYKAGRISQWFKGVSSKVSARLYGYLQSKSWGKWFIKTGKTIKTISAASKAGKSLAMGIGISAAQFILSGGDWTQTSITFAQFTIMAYAPKLFEKLVVNKAYSFIVAASGRTSINAGFERVKATLAKIPVVGVPAAYATHAAEVAINFIWSVYDTVDFDLFLLKVYSGASAAVNKEKSLLYCKDFVTNERILLTPPNCVPKAGFRDESVLGKWQNFSATLATLSSATFGAGIPIAISSALITPGGATQEVSTHFLLVTQTNAILSAIAAFGPLVTSVIKNPASLIDIMPVSECEVCDREYSRQDCPNWFISDPGGRALLAGAEVLPALELGPVCAALSSAGWASFDCNGARLMLAIATYLREPENVVNWMLQGYTVGLNKNVSSKSDPEFAELGPIFSDNKGFWYAELPYVIEFTKIYANDKPTLESRTLPLVIRKM
jgi:hypothetical protein